MPAGRTLLTVIAPTAMTLLLCNLDRICLSVAIVPIAREYGWAPGLQARALLLSAGPRAAGCQRSCPAQLPAAAILSAPRSLSPARPARQGVVQSAFLWGYMATQLLGGTLADRFGGALAPPPCRALLRRSRLARGLLAALLRKCAPAPPHPRGCQALRARAAGKVVMACGIAWFSLASLLLPTALSAPVRPGAGRRRPARVPRRQSCIAEGVRG
jgi:MFS family permease